MGLKSRDWSHWIRLEIPLVRAKIDCWTMSPKECAIELPCIRQLFCCMQYKSKLHTMLEWKSNGC